MDVPVAPRVAGRMPMLVSAAVAAPASAAAPVVVNRPRPTARWAVQVGSFTTEKAARQAAVAARRIADSGEARVETVTVQRRQSFRAQVTGLTQAEVQEACSTLSRRKIPCVPIRPEARQIASR
jgi:hypothetical protein